MCVLVTMRVYEIKTFKITFKVSVFPGPVSHPCSLGCKSEGLTWESRGCKTMRTFCLHWESGMNSAWNTWRAEFSGKLPRQLGGRCRWRKLWTSLQQSGSSRLLGWYNNKRQGLLKWSLIQWSQKSWISLTHWPVCLSKISTGEEEHHKKKVVNLIWPTEA